MSFGPNRDEKIPASIKALANLKEMSFIPSRILHYTCMQPGFSAKFIVTSLAEQWYRLVYIHLWVC